DAPSGIGRASDGHRRASRPPAQRRAGGLLPALDRPDRRRGDAAAVQRAGTERARVHRADALPRPARRRAARDGASGSRSARAFVPAQAVVVVGLPPASDELRRVRCDRRCPRGLLAERRRRGVQGVRRAVAGTRAQHRGDPFDRDAAHEPARRCRHGRLERAVGPRRAASRPGLVRVPRRLPPANALGVRRDLGDGYELDDDRERVDVDAVHAYLSGESYWAKGRPRTEVERLVRESQRIVGLYKDGAQIGFCRAASDGVSFAYLADVYVLPEHRGRGLGLELVREMVEEGPYANRKWIRHTRDMHALYAKLGFGAPGERLMEREPTERKA